MKKTLVAAAILAASGASFAQATITGTVSMGYEADHHATGTLGDTSGLGMDTTVLDIKATEDLGGGMKATAAMQLDGVSRGGVSGGDASLSLSGSFGTLTLANAKGADYLSAGVATVGGNGFDGKVFSARTTADSIGYAYPMGAVTLSLTHAEPANQNGLGAGAGGAQTTYTTTNFDGTVSAATEVQRSTRIAAKYAAGALVVDGGYAVYDQQGTAEGNDKSQFRAAGSYDLGMVKLGGGVVRNTKNVGTRTDWLVSAGLPLGALTLGANYAIRTTNDYTAAASNGTINGYGLSVSYALSKRTSLSGAYTNFKQALTASENSSYAAALINHSF